VFGGAAINIQQGGVDLAGEGSIEEQLFSVLEQYPIATVASVLVMVLVAIFFVSGADAASIVMGSLSERGTIEPSRTVVVFWGVVMGAVAAIMLLVGGDEALTGLQNLTIIAALPFALVMVGMAVSLAKDVRSDPLMLRRSVAAEAVEQAVVDGITRHGEDFVLVVEAAPDADHDGIPDTPTRSTPLPAAEQRGPDGDRTARDVGSPLPEAAPPVPARDR
jgi:choline-glycine betaine transporter